MTRRSTKLSVPMAINMWLSKKIAKPLPTWKQQAFYNVADLMKQHGVRPLSDLGKGHTYDALAHHIFAKVRASKETLTHTETRDLERRMQADERQWNREARAKAKDEAEARHLERLMRGQHR